MREFKTDQVTGGSSGNAVRIAQVEEIKKVFPLFNDADKSDVYVRAFYEQLTMLANEVSSANEKKEEKPATTDPEPDEEKEENIHGDSADVALTAMRNARLNMKEV